MDIVLFFAIPVVTLTYSILLILSVYRSVPEVWIGIVSVLSSLVLISVFFLFGFSWKAVIYSLLFLVLNYFVLLWPRQDLKLRKVLRISWAVLLLLTVGIAWGAVFILAYSLGEQGFGPI